MTLERPAVDNWDPLPLQHAREVFAGAPFRWWICGGIALELYAQESWRIHEDLDIGVLRFHAGDVHTWLSPDWDFWVAARGQLTPWKGDPLDVERDENNVWARKTSRSPWRFDLTFGSGTDTHWIYRRDEETFRPWDTAVLRTTDGLPYLAPDLQLLFKSKNPRPKDHLDAEKTIPLLEADQRAFLDACLDAGHPWQALLGKQ